MPRLEIAVFIEDVVGRKERFEGLANRLATLQQGGGVEERLSAPFVAIDIADEERCLANAGMQTPEQLQILRHKARFEDQVLRRITGGGELG